MQILLFLKEKPKSKPTEYKTILEKKINGYRKIFILNVCSIFYLITFAWKLYD